MTLDSKWGVPWNFRSPVTICNNAFSPGRVKSVRQERRMSSLIAGQICSPPPTKPCDEVKGVSYLPTQNWGQSSAGTENEEASRFDSVVSLGRSQLICIGYSSRTSRERLVELGLSLTVPSRAGVWLCPQSIDNKDCRGYFGELWEPQLLVYYKSSLYYTTTCGICVLYLRISLMVRAGMTHWHIPRAFFLLKCNVDLKFVGVDHQLWLEQANTHIFACVPN